MNRIVSLLPSATELVCLLGQREQLVGRSHECDFPPDVKALPACTSPKINPAAPGGEIHQQVESLVRQGLSIYDVDSAQLRALRPDLILTQTQCDVCAVSEKDV